MFTEYKNISNKIEKQCVNEFNFLLRLKKVNKLVSPGLIAVLFKRFSETVVGPEFRIKCFKRKCSYKKKIIKKIDTFYATALLSSAELTSNH